MLKNPDSRLRAAAAPDQAHGARQSAPELALHMRAGLAAALHALVAGQAAVRLPPSTGDWVSRGDGHFHLAPELFVQLAGWTLFRFPHAELKLDAGEALLLPPRLLHAERIGSDDDGQPFRNVVIYAEHSALTCHLAHEQEPGVPGILHLEAGYHPEAQHIQHWLTDAARLGRQPASSATDWSALQARALVLAAAVGVVRVLDDLAADARPEPPLVARARVLIHNQLGDHQLSVRGLAEQLGCTADYLSHLFRQHGGEALAGYINRRRMERAAHLLSETRLAIKEVAFSCGFAAPSYFIRHFRMQYGMTPKAWRAGRQEEG